MSAQKKKEEEEAAFNSGLLLLLWEEEEEEEELGSRVEEMFLRAEMLGTVIDLRRRLCRSRREKMVLKGLCVQISDAALNDTTSLILVGLETVMQTGKCSFASMHNPRVSPPSCSTWLTEEK